MAGWEGSLVAVGHWSEGPCEGGPQRVRSVAPSPLVDAERNTRGHADKFRAVTPAYQKERHGRGGENWVRVLG